MGIRNSLSKPSEGSTVVEKYVNTAYDEVKVVSDNINSVVAVADAIAGDDFDDVMENIDNIVIVADNVDSVNTVADDIDNVNIAAANIDAIIAAPQHAEDAENAAAIAIAAANYVGYWVDLVGPLDTPASVAHNNVIWNLMVDVPDVTLSEPSLTNDDWGLIGTVDGTAPDSERLGGELPEFYLDPDNHDDTTSTNKWTSQAEIDKLGGIEAGATGDMTAAEIKTEYESNSNTNAFTDSEKSSVATAVQSSEKGVANGVATLDVAGQVPSNQLPSYVDDVIEVDTYADLPAEGETGKIYVVIVDETNNDTTSVYRWSGSTYVLITSTMSAEDIKNLYESNPDTNAFTDSDKDQLDALADAEVLHNVTTAQDFFALAEKRIRDNAGSGFAEWGKVNVTSQAVNQGLYAIHTSPNLVGLGRVDGNGLSRTDYAIMNVNGVHQRITAVNTTATGNQANVYLPPAPDGTKTYDSSTGAVVQHADSATAFASETATNKVIVSRQDYVFVESWHELVSDKDEVYYLGAVQSALTDPYGITSYTRSDGYTRFGEWDSTTTGQAVVWSTLTDEQKLTFLQDPENNLYVEDGELIQVRYRIRTHAGVGDVVDENRHFFNEASTGTMGRIIPPQGSLINVPALQPLPNGSIFSLQKPEVYTKLSSGVLGEDANGLYMAANKYNDGALNTSVAYKGLCFAIPIALVQRRNRGIGHGTLNPNGCKLASDSKKWYETSISFLTTADCFNASKLLVASGGIGEPSGRWNGDGKTYNGIISSDVEDLRMSSRRVPVSQLRESYKRKAIAGEVRGFEGVPFTKVLTGSSSNAWFAFNTSEVVAYDGNDELEPNWISQKAPIGTVIALVDGNNVGVFEHKGVYQGVEIRYQLISGSITSTSTVVKDATHYVMGSYFGAYAAHKQANPTWTDIIGDPANIAATFPDGVEGMWIPKIPDGNAAQFFDMNRKNIDALSAEYSALGAGTDWTNFDLGNLSNTNNNIDPVTNRLRSAPATGSVLLAHYETQAHFTEDDVNSEVLDLGEVYGSNRYSVDYGGTLTASLIGKVPTSTVDISGYHTGLTQYVKHNSGKLWSADPKPKHNTLDLKGDTSVAVKTLDYLSSEDGVAKLCYAYKEMIYDVTWGDNNQFEITDNQSVLTDDNGNTVLYGTASFNTQYFIDGSD